MTIELLVALLALVVAFTAAIFNLAALDAEGQKRLRDLTAKLSSSAYRIGGATFVFVALVNGSAGVALFGLSPGAPSRGDVLMLLLCLFNIAIGLWHWHDMAKKPVGINNSKRARR